MTAQDDKQAVEGVALGYDYLRQAKREAVNHVLSMVAREKARRLLMSKPFHPDWGI